MLTFVQFLEEIAAGNQRIIVAPEEVDQLVRRFGNRVREMGQWNTSDGSLEIPVSAIIEAAQQVGSRTLNEAVKELKAKPDEFIGLLRSCSASILIDKICELGQRKFRELMLELRQTEDPAEIKRLKEEIDLAIFGK